MKKIITIVFFLCANIKMYSYNIDNYRLMSEAKKASEQKEYHKSKKLFEAYERNYKDTYPIESNYLKFYIGKNLMRLGEYDKSIYYLDKAVYVPEEYVEQKTRKTNFFEYRRNYYIGEMYKIKGNKKLSDEYLKRLIKNYYSEDLEKYEIDALNILGKNDKEYQYIKEVKYQNNLENLNKISIDYQKKIAEFFYTKQEYDILEKVLENIKERVGLEKKLENFYLEVLFRLKRFDEILLITNDRKNPESFFLRGKVYNELKDFNEAIKNYREVGGRLKEEALYEIAEIYYKNGNYKEAKKIIDREMQEKTPESVLMYLNILIRERDRKEFIRSYEKYRNDKITGYNQGIYYTIYTQLKDRKKEPWAIKDYGTLYSRILLTRLYTSSLPIYERNKEFEDENLTKTIKEISDLKDEELIDVAINDFELDASLNENIRSIIAIEGFANGGFYKTALQTANKNRRTLSKYQNTFKYLYPKYYEKDIEELLKKYIVPENLVYTSIYVQSKFDKRFRELGRNGLLGIYGTNGKEITVKENLEAGIKVLEMLYNINEKFALKTLIEYNLTESERVEVQYGENGDILINEIHDISLKEKLEEIIYTYSFYSIIYN